MKAFKDKTREDGEAIDLKWAQEQADDSLHMVAEYLECLEACQIPSERKKYGASLSKTIAQLCFRMKLVGVLTEPEEIAKEFFWDYAGRIEMVEV